jgi:hypothetical protein
MTLIIWLLVTAPILDGTEYKITAIGGSLLWLMSRNNHHFG